MNAISRIHAPTQPIARGWRDTPPSLVLEQFIVYASSRPKFWPLIEKIDNCRETRKKIIHALRTQVQYRLEVRYYEGPSVVFGNSRLPMIIFRPGTDLDCHLQIDYGDCYILLGEVLAARKKCRVIPAQRRQMAA